MNDNSLVIDIETLLAEANPPITDDCCIYRVPNEIREVNVDAYIPKCISIGPFHHYDPRLQKMERYKRLYFKQFVARTNIKLKDLVSSVKDVEIRLRRCYSENLEMSTDKLVRVILLDACFIVELIYSYCHDEMTDDEKTMLKDQLFYFINLDLLLLENQVPFFILENLYNLAFASHSKSFLKLSIQYFKHQNKQEIEHDFTISHFTDLIRTFHLQHPSPGRGKSYLKHILSASAFNEAGVKFQKNESKCISNFEFSRNCLKIPCILVQDNTEVLFRNMVALELCHYPDEGYIIDYVSVMNSLINTGEDVDVLVKNKILLNWLDDTDAVANLFNGLCKNVVQSGFNSEYVDVFDRLDVFYNTPCRKLMTALRHDYFTTPWQNLATIGLVYTFIQTLCSIIQVVYMFV